MSVVDGQQRLTTNYKAYCNHPDLKNVVLDLGKGEFIINPEAYRKNQIPVGILLNKDDTKLIEYTEKNKTLSSPAIVNALLQIRNKIKLTNILSILQQTFRRMNKLTGLRF